MTEERASDPRVAISTSDPGGELARRLTRLAVLRLGVLTVFLAIISLLYLRGRAPGGFSSLVAFLAVAAGYALAGIYVALLRSRRLLPVVARLQLVTDQLGWTALVYVSGGITSGATSLYGLTCLSGAILLGARGGITAFVAALASYVALAAAFALSWLRPPADQSPEVYLVALSDMTYPVVANLLALGMVTGLGIYLAERLASTGTSLAIATARAEEAEQLAVLGRLAAGLAHEIRNPLGAIAGSIELLRESSGLTPEDRALCLLVEREASRLEDLVTDMLDLARPRPPALEDVDVSVVASEVSLLAAQSGRGGDVVVRYEGPERAMLRADPAQLRQVLWNLVRNAVQVSSPGDEVEVRVSPAPGERLAIEVCDHGPGIDANSRARIFDAFFTTRTQGTGLGLAVVKRVADAHGWTITVVDTPGGGATFRLTAPSSGPSGVGTAEEAGA